MGYFSAQADKLNSFQLILIQQGTEGDFDIVFNYDKVQWETGSAGGGSGGFGGTPAAAGWANGDGEHFDLRPGSFDSTALLDANTSTGLIHGMLGAGNTQPGRYVFEVRNAGVSGPVLEGRVQHQGDAHAINAPVEICPVAGGPCRVRNTNQKGTYRATGLPAGAYSITANPPDGSEDTPVSTQVTMADTDLVAAILTLGAPPQGPPDGTSIESIDIGPNGVPVVIYGTSPRLEATGCAGGTASFEIASAGTRVVSGALGPQCDRQHHDRLSGGSRRDDRVRPLHRPERARTRLHGRTGRGRHGRAVPLRRLGGPVRAGAGRQRRHVAVQPHQPGPHRRRRPLRLGRGGRLLQGAASKDGCVSDANRSQAFAETHVMTIPRPVTDLDIRLHCEAGGDGGGDGGGGSTTGGGGSASAAALASLGRIALSGTKVVVPVFCASAARAACKGSLTIKAKSGKKKRAKRIAIGSAKFSGGGSS